MKTLGKYSFGMGDRFGREGDAQLAAVQAVKDQGVEVDPVWNKSHREHEIVGTNPADVRKEADEAVAAAEWKGRYFVDADHINLGNVDGFVGASDFFTVDVADFIGKLPPDEKTVAEFVSRQKDLTGTLSLPGIDQPFHVTPEDVERSARLFLVAVREARKVVDRIRKLRDDDDFVVEVSLDETDRPQSPVEFLMLLKMISERGIPAQTVAPRLGGLFFKGVDFVGDPKSFQRETEEILAATAFAVREFGLPAGLKLSIHSGSDKFSIYPALHRAIRKFDAGLHVKTAGTTWLEELIGLAESEGAGADFVRKVHAEAMSRREALCAPYAAVVQIDPEKLPTPEETGGWSGARMASALRHVPDAPEYNRDLRQLMHVAYKIAAEAGKAYPDLLDACRDRVTENVKKNLLERHLKPLFLGTES